MDPVRLGEVIETRAGSFNSSVMVCADITAAVAASICGVLGTAPGAVGLCANVLTAPEDCGCVTVGALDCSTGAVSLGYKNSKPSKIAIEMTMAKNKLRLSMTVSQFLMAAQAIGSGLKC